MPPAAYNRLADNWRPLFAIAHIVGGDWPRRAQEAFHHLNPQRPANRPKRLAAPKPSDGGLVAPKSDGGRPTGDSQLSTLTPGSQLLLAAIRQIFTQSGISRVSSKQLLDAVRALANRHYPALRNPHCAFKWLSRSLRPFGIKPHAMRIGHTRVKGYDLADFTDAFSRSGDIGDKPCKH